jgi:nucleoid-associated protein YgaU
MSNQWERVFGGLVLGAGLSVGVFWWWPSPAAITFDRTERPVAVREPAPPPPATIETAQREAPPLVRQTEAAAPVEYVVKRGETLGAIARARYGSARYADAIYQANRDRLRSAHAVGAGQTIVLPPKDSIAGSDARRG